MAPTLERENSLNYETIIVEKAEGVGTITLDRPDVLNAISRGMYREIDEALTDMEADPAVRAIIFTGMGERAFSAGADIKEAARIASDPGASDSQAPGPDVSWHVASCVKPTIGALNGLAYGGAAVLASSFDIRVGCERTSFRFLAASYGRVNSTWSLPMQVGWPVAKELLFTARVVQAEEAYRMGLLNRLVSSGDLMQTALEIGRQIAGNDPRMVQGIKDLLIGNSGQGWKQMHENEVEAQAGRLAPTPLLEGFKDFLERKGT